MRRRTYPAIDPEVVLTAMGGSVDSWACQCHGASLHLVKTGVLGTDARVARGSAHGVLGQHSWVVCGDPYDTTNPIVDITLWSYDETQPKVWIGTGDDGVHTPHGAGSIFTVGKPHSTGEDPIDITPPGGWSPSAAQFLKMLGPLDVRGWMMLAHCPVGGGWPAKEIITAMYNTKGLKALIPIDIVGMVTDLNPDGLYW